MGKGAAVVPEKGEVAAPEDCVVESIFDTGHAIGLKTMDGVELLIHVGLDTVELKGKYFEVHVKQGEKAARGQLLISFDIQGIKEAGYDVTTPIVVANTPDYLDVLAKKVGKAGKDLITILK